MQTIVELARKEPAFRAACRVAAMFWLFIVVLLAGAYYSMVRMAQTAPALRRAILEFGLITERRQGDRIPGLVQEVIAGWGDRLAEFPLGLTDWLQPVALVVLVALSFRLVAPRIGATESALRTSKLTERQRAHFAEAAWRSGVFTDILIWPQARVTAIGHNFIAGSNILGAALQRLRDPALPDRLGFYMAHEMVHLASRDNLALSLGRYVSVFLAVLTAFVTFGPASFALTFLLSAAADRLVPNAVGIALMMGGGVLLVVVLGRAAFRMLTDYEAVREYYADQVAVRLFGPEAHGYVLGPEAATPDPAEIGPEERASHLGGTTLRRHALLAGLLSNWIVVRTAILFADFGAAQGPVWMFDAACLVLILAIWRELPPQGRHGRWRYGRGPWLLCLAAAFVGQASAGALLTGLEQLSQARIQDTLWFGALAWPPRLALLAAGLAFLAWRPWRHDGRAAPAPPRQVGRPGRLPLRILAAPGRLASLAVALFMSVIAAEAITELLLRPGAGAGFLLRNLLVFSVASGLLVLAARNLFGPARWSLVLETALIAPLIALIMMATLVTAQLAVQQTQAPAGFPVAPEVIEARLKAWAPADSALLGFLFLFAAALLAVSAWARLRAPARH